MSSSEIYALCIYYKGDDNCPLEKNSMPFIFWLIEKEFCKLYFSIYADKHPYFKYLDKKFENNSLGVKAFLEYFVALKIKELNSLYVNGRSAGVSMKSYNPKI